MAKVKENSLGNYLKNRRARLDPALLGIAATRRRTPGLRREEVAQRANVSVTWYTWLEQGRGGTPSADVLDGIADALALTAAEREHLFLLAQHRPPEAQYQATEHVTPQLQRVLDSLPFSPAIVKTATWDIVAWNHAAAVVLTDYSKLAPPQRNILRMLFCSPHLRANSADWQSFARSAVAAFRAETARFGASQSVEALIEELRRASPEFEAIWCAHDVQSHGEGVKHFRHSTAGAITLEYSTFAVNGCLDLSLLIYTPATPTDVERIRMLVEGQP